MKNFLRYLLILTMVFAFPLSAIAKENGSDNQSGLPDKVKQLEEKLNSVSELFNSQQELIHSLQEQIKEQKETIQSQSNEIIALKQKNEQVDSRLTQTENKTGFLEGIYNSLVNIVNEIKEKLDMDQQDVYSVSGRAILKNGTPITQTNIHIFNEQSGKFVGQTDRYGNFTFPGINNGTYTIKFGNVDNPILQDVVVVNGSNITDLIIESEEELYSISGKASFTNGLPILSSGIYYTSDRGLNGYHGYGLDQGLFNITGLPSGTYTIKFGNPDTPIVETVVLVDEEDAAAEVVSPLEAVRVTGNLLDSDGEQFLFSNYVRDPIRNVRFSNEIVNQYGQFVYVLPKNNNYEFHLEHDADFVSNKAFETGEEDSVNTFHYEQPTFDIQGKVLNANGEPFSWENIDLGYSRGIYGAGWRTNEKGEFVIKGLPAGEYEMFVGDDFNSPLASKKIRIINEDLSDITVQP